MSFPQGKLWVEMASSVNTEGHQALPSHLRTQEKGRLSSCFYAGPGTKTRDTLPRNCRSVSLEHTGKNSQEILAEVKDRMTAISHPGLRTRQ